MRSVRGAVRGNALAIMTACAALALPAAAAADGNLLPNPSFETDCAGMPCNWSVGGSGLGATDLLLAHSGSASLRLVAVDGRVTTHPSSCIDATFRNNDTLELSFWWYARSPGSEGATMTVAFYKATGCVQPPFMALQAADSQDSFTGARAH